MNEIWTEKYRPRTLDDVVGQKHVTERLKAYVESRNMPHLLLTGPAGTGKTTCSLALAKSMFGDEWKGNFIELNASDERGIDVVRGKIKEFARTAPIGGAEFKIIFMDEADALTSDAQAALRRTMEKYSGICRFILSCNYSSKIIDPIQSRCAVFRFKPLTEDDLREYIMKIVKAEGIDIDDEAVSGLVRIARGDMRRAVNSLQVAASLGTRIDLDAIYKTSGMAKPELIKQMLETALGGNFIRAREMLEEAMIEYGLSGQDIIRQIHSTFFDLSITDAEKVRLMDKTGEIEFRIVEGSNERIQLEALLAYLVMVGGSKRRSCRGAFFPIGPIASPEQMREDLLLRLFEDLPGRAENEDAVPVHQVPVVDGSRHLGYVQPGQEVPQLVGEPYVHIRATACEVREVHAGGAEHLEPRHGVPALGHQPRLREPEILRPAAEVARGQYAFPEGLRLGGADGLPVAERPALRCPELLAQGGEEDYGGLRGPVLHEDALNAVERYPASEVHRAVDGVDDPRPP